MSALADEKPDADGWFGKHQRGAWIAAGASIVAALIAVLVPVLTSSGDDTPTPPAAVPSVAPTSSATVPATVPTSPATTPRTTTPTVSPPPSRTEPPPATPGPSRAGTQLWRGALLLDTEPKDLDSAPPDRVGYSTNGDVSIELNHDLLSANGTLIAQWSGATLPGYADCSTAVDSLGSREPTKLSKRTVLCVRTSEQNIARLKVTSVPTGLEVKTTFDVVTWNAD